MKRTERGILPEMAEVLADGLGVMSENSPEQRQAKQRSSLGKREDVLH